MLEQSFTDRGKTLRRFGVLARFRAEDPERRVILPHEHTRAAAKEDRWRVLNATKANFSPIFLMFPDPQATFAALVPLTIVMTPDKKPFFAATYLPKGSRFGRAGLMELIPRISEVWTSRQKDVLESAENLTTALQSLEKESSGEPLDASVLDKAYEELSQRFDKTYGGFSGAPKFPTPHNFFFMLRHWRRADRREALEMVEKTLQEIRWGGIFDQIGFGFHRYSTDREWLVPHFEKMLYDQAMLALAYLETYHGHRERAIC